MTGSDNSGLAISILGPLRVEVDSAEQTIVSRKQRRLLAELALRRGDPVSRDQLMSELWPESDEAHARDSLRHALWQLHSQLGPARGALRAGRNSITLDENAAVDVTVFEPLAQSDQPEAQLAALELYRGDLCAELEGMFAESERERLRRTFVVLGTRVASHRLSAGDPVGAIEIIRRILQRDPYREEIHRQLLEALIAAGVHETVQSLFRTLAVSARK